MGQEFNVMMALLMLTVWCVMLTNPVSGPVHWNSPGWAEFFTDGYSQAMSEYLFVMPPYR